MDHNAPVVLPRIHLATDDAHEIARVIRGALRLRTEIVPLVEPPSGPGQHLLDIAVPGVGVVSLLAKQAGSARPDGYPLAIQPVTRVQMAELFSLVERLDEPSHSDPPPSNNDEPDADSDDRTISDALPSRVMLPQSVGFGFVDSIPPLAETAPPPPGPSAAPPSIVGLPPPSPVASIGRGSPVNAVPIDPRIGRVLAGKYQIEAPVGRGAAATVYRAVHKDLRRAVAVKILHAENQVDPRVLRRFKAEALTASKLEHANITRVLDFGEERGELYIVMELVAGRTLEAIISETGKLAPKRVVDIGIQVCRALVFAHGKGVIHRDIKPENVMLVPDADDDGEPCDLVKVCDFGLAKMRRPIDGEGAELTVHGMLCGSPAYMSPEQTRGDELDARTDVYSLGVTMFEALTSALPIDEESIGELFLKKCTIDPRRASELAAGVTPLLDTILARTMAIDPNDRPASARELRTELRKARDQFASDEDDDDRATIHGT